jgi:hypothetical protein
MLLGNFKDQNSKALILHKAESRASVKHKMLDGVYLWIVVCYLDFLSTCHSACLSGDNHNESSITCL